MEFFFFFNFFNALFQPPQPSQAPPAEFYNPYQLEDESKEEDFAASPTSSPPYYKNPPQESPPVYQQPIGGTSYKSSEGVGAESFEEAGGSSSSYEFGFTEGSFRIPDFFRNFLSAPPPWINIGKGNKNWRRRRR